MVAQIHTFKSIITLIVFLLTNLVVVFPFSIPIYVPASWVVRIRPALVRIRILSKGADSRYDENGDERMPISFSIPFNFVTMPIISVIFLLCLRAIGRQEVHDGILGADNIVPIDIMAFFLTLAYLAISLDATGMIRFLAFWVLKKGGGVGHRLYFLLYAFFFFLGSFIGNDPIILSGTAFLAYLTRVAANIKHPRAWIYAQFAVANISSAILVSSNPTNLVLAGAFQISFLTYTANMIVPVILTGIILFPFLLYIIFPSDDLIPYKIDLHALPSEEVHSPGAELTLQQQDEREERERKNRELREIMDPFLDKKGAFFGSVLITITLTTLLATNAAGLHPGVWTMTVPAGFIMFCRDAIYDWSNRHKTRELARKKRIHKAEKLRRRREEKAKERALLAAARQEQGQNGHPLIMTEQPSPNGPNALELSEKDDEETAADYVDEAPINIHPLARNYSSNVFEPLDDDDEVDIGADRDRDTPPVVENGGLGEQQRAGTAASSYFPHQPQQMSPTSHRGRGGHGRMDSLATTDTGTSLGSPISPRTLASTSYLVPGPSPGPMMEAPPASPNKKPRNLPSLIIESTERLTNSELHSSPTSENSLSGGSGEKEISDQDRHEVVVSTENEKGKGREGNGNGHADPTAITTTTTTTPPKIKHRSIAGAWRKLRRHAKETFPTVCAVIEHLPFALLPFAFSMFILVQGLVTKGWVEVFANGWNGWVQKTGTVGAVGGMGFVSVCLCNFAGTNIGTSILLSRVLQAWFRAHPITDRTRDASVYALALGVNYGAFSAAFNASLAGLLWRDILSRKHIRVRRLDFARINLPIIAIAMSVGCGVLTLQVYLVKANKLELRDGT